MHLNFKTRSSGQDLGQVFKSQWLAWTVARDILHESTPLSFLV